MAIRRVVTGYEADGTPGVQIDGDAPAEMDLPPEVGATLVDLWRSEAVPLDASEPGDPTAGDFEMMPAGSLFRIIDLQPGDHPPLWHTTATVDFIYVASGTATLLTDDAETDIPAGGTCVQRGVHHAWVNHGTRGLPAGERQRGRHPARRRRTRLTGSPVPPTPADDVVPGPQLHPRPRRERPALAPLANRRELRRLPGAAPGARASACSTWAAGPAPSPSTWPDGWRRPARAGRWSASTPRPR